MPFGLGKSEKRSEDDEAVEPLERDAASAGGDEEADESASNGSEQEPDNPLLRSMAFRRSFIERGQEQPGRGAAAATAPAAKAPPRVPEADAFFVTVVESGETRIHRFPAADEAQAFVGDLLAKGVSQEDVEAFSARKLTFKVSHRPTVKLGGGEED